MVVGRALFGCKEINGFPVGEFAHRHRDGATVPQWDGQGGMECCVHWCRRFECCERVLQWLDKTLVDGMTASRNQDV